MTFEEAEKKVLEYKKLTGQIEMFSKILNRYDTVRRDTKHDVLEIRFETLKEIDTIYDNNHTFVYDTDHKTLIDTIYRNIREYLSTLELERDMLFNDKYTKITNKKEVPAL